MNRNQIYINGQPVTLLQKIVASVVGIAILVGLFFLTAALLPFILLIIAGFIGFVWWRTRHIRAMIRQQQAMMNEAMKQAEQQASGHYSSPNGNGKSSDAKKAHKGETLEGDYKEL